VKNGPFREKITRRLVDKPSSGTIFFRKFVSLYFFHAWRKQNFLSHTRDSGKKGRVTRKR